MASDADIAAIRQARLEMNRLFATHDMDGLRKFLDERATEDVQITGPQWRYAGRQAAFDIYKERTVIRRPLLTWDHTPREIEVNDAQNYIAERGTYTQRWPGKGQGVVNQWVGPYLALWKRFTPNGPWLLDAETYIPIQCTGDNDRDACEPRMALRADIIKSTVPPRTTR